MFKALISLLCVVIVKARARKMYILNRVPYCSFVLVITSFIGI